LAYFLTIPLLAAALVGMIIVAAYKNKLIHDKTSNFHTIDAMWRLLIGIGCVPGCIALYFRLTIPETPRFTMDIERNIHQASHDITNVLTTGNSAVDPDAVVQRAQAPKASWSDFVHYFSQWKNGKILLGTAYSWFALDVCIFH
jgi:MFS transporter, PHS family, inorganic phosphate transporter